MFNSPDENPLLARKIQPWEDANPKDTRPDYLYNETEYSSHRR